MVLEHVLLLGSYTRESIPALHKIGKYLLEATEEASIAYNKECVWVRSTWWQDLEGAYYLHFLFSAIFLLVLLALCLGFSDLCYLCFLLTGVYTPTRSWHMFMEGFCMKKVS